MVQLFGDAASTSPVAYDNAVHVSEIIVVFAEPAIVDALISGARAEPDHESRHSLLDFHGSSENSVVSKPAQFIQADSVDVRYCGAVEGQNGFQIVIGDG